MLHPTGSQQQHAGGMSLPVSCPPQTESAGGTPSPLGGYASSEASLGGPFGLEAGGGGAGSASSGGTFSNGNYSPYDPAGYPVTSSQSSDDAGAG
jgi:hypothetical protein